MSALDSTPGTLSRRMGGLVAASALLLAGALPSAARADCPCVGTPYTPGAISSGSYCIDQDLVDNTGEVTVLGGSLTIGSNVRLTTSGTVTVSGGTLEICEGGEIDARGSFAQLTNTGLLRLHEDARLSFVGGMTIARVELSDRTVLESCATLASYVASPLIYTGRLDQAYIITRAHVDGPRMADTANVNWLAVNMEEAGITMPPGGADFCLAPPGAGAPLVWCDGSSATRSGDLALDGITNGGYSYCGEALYLDLAVPDHDFDGVLDVDEDLDRDGDPWNDDTDDDGIPNFLDTDDDNDDVPTRGEDPDGDGEPRNDHTDDDGTPDYLDADHDGDGLDSPDEDVDGDGDPRNDDTDDDGTPNHRDPDDDGDTVATEDEDIDRDGDPRNDDTDDDGTPDYLDPDDDGDGLSTSDEDVNGNGDPMDDDTDGDGTPDYLDAHDDSEPPDDTGDTDTDDTGDTAVRPVDAGRYAGGWSGCGCQTSPIPSGLLLLPLLLLYRRPRG